MKIDTGNFGQAQRQVVDTRIDRGNPAEMAEAKISSARNTAQLQGMANQAWDRLGGQMQQVGAEMHQQIRQLAQQKSALVIQQKQLHAQGVLQEAQDNVDSGKLKSADVQKFVSDAMSKFKYDDIDGLGEGGRMQLEKGLQGVDMSVSQSTNHLYRAAHKVETRATTDEMISNNERLALTSGADLDKAASLYDSPVFQAQAREAYGAEFGKVITQAKAGIYAAGAKKMVLDNRDSYSGLQAIQKEFQEGGKFYQKLDADTELSITGQIDSRKSTLEAQAAAEAARAAARQQAAAAKQMAAENRAQSARVTMQEFIAQGGVPDKAYLEQYSQITQGTGLQNDAKNMAVLAQQTQQFSALPIQQQEAVLQQKAVSLKQGSNPAELKVFNAMQNAHQAQKKALIDDPIGTVATRAGVPIPPIDLTHIQNAKDPESIKAANQEFAASMYQRAALTKQAREQTPEAPKVLLTPQERSDFKSYAEKLPPGEKANFYKTLANAGGRFGVDLVKEVSGSDTMAAAAYHQATAPNSTAGALIAQGDDLINDKKSNYKAPPVSKFQPEIDSALADALPPKQRSTVANAVNAHYVASRVAAGKDPSQIDSDDYQDSITAVVGSVIQYGNSKIVVPANTDPNKFRESLYQNVMQLPNGKDAMALIETGQARVQAVGAKTYMLTTPSGAPRFDPQTGKPVYIQVP